MGLIDLGVVKGDTGNTGETGEKGDTGAKGVGISSIESITDGIRFCLTNGANWDINLTPPTPSYDSIVVTTDKSILSAFDSDKATLYAQLMNEQSTASICGVTITFKKGTTILGTATTDNTGLATLTDGYSSTGAGDITITATDGTLSGTKSIEDCIGFNSMTSANDVSLFNLGSGMPITYSSNGAKFNNTTNNTAYTSTLKNTYSDPVSIEFDLTENDKSSSAPSYTPILDLNNTHDDYNSIVIECASPRTTVRTRGGSGNYTDTTVSSTLGHYKILLESNTQYKVYIDDVLVATVSNATISTKGCSIFVGGGRTATIKNFKIKPL